MAWDSPEIIAYSKDKEQTAYQFGYIIGSTLLAVMMAFVVKDAAEILADKQLMGNAKLQFRGILSQRDCIALAAGSKGGIAIQIGQVYTPEAVAVIEGSISTAAEQGIILKAGKVLAAGYPAGKIGADTTEKICDEVKDGETDAEEIAEEISEEKDKWSSENLDIEKMFTDKSIEHLEKIDGFDRKRNGIKGAHTLDSFNRFSEEFRPLEVLSKEKISDGIYEINYKAAKIERGKPVIKADGTYDCFSKTFTKTVIDTSEISIDQITSMAKEAFTSRGAYVTEKNQIYINGIAKNGVKFDGWLNSETKQLESFYPVKKFKFDY